MIIYPIPELLPDPRARFIQVINTCRALAEKGVEVTLFCGIKKGYSEKDIAAYYGLRIHPNLRIIKLPILRREYGRHFRISWHGVFHFFLLLHLLRERRRTEKKFVLLLRHLKLADFLLTFKRVLRIPFIFEAHEIFHLGVAADKKRKGIDLLEQRVYRMADIIISISESLRQYLVRTGVPPEKIYVIHDSVKGDWLSMHKSPTGSYLCYTGSLYQWKGVDILITAMKYLPDERLLIVGGGGRLEELRRLAKTEGVEQRVTFTDTVPHGTVPVYLAEAKIAILPNISSGPTLFSSPLKLFEYMASGVPVAAANIAAFREILTDMRNALLFEAGNPKALAAALQKLSMDRELAERLAHTARKDAESYTYEKRAEQIYSLAEGAVGK